MRCEICDPVIDDPNIAQDGAFWYCQTCGVNLYAVCQYFEDTTGDSGWSSRAWWRSINESDVAPFNAFMAGAGHGYRAKKEGCNFVVRLDHNIDPAQYTDVLV